MTEHKFRPMIQLHNHSRYSVLDAIPTPQEWLEWCLETGTPGIAITDHGYSISMFHAIRFKQYIKEYNAKHGTSHPLDAVTGIPAVELYVKMNAEDAGHHHLTAWAVSNEGFKNLMKLSSIAWQDTVTFFGSPKPRVTFAQVQEYKAGKIGRAHV